MKTQHTWTVSKHAVPEGIYQAGIYTEDGREVATVKSSEANAQLMAAAPDLLDALDEIQGTIEAYGFDGVSYHWIVEKAAKAIAKATQQPA